MKTILYIEDNSLNMRLVCKHVQSFGYNLIGAYDGLSGLDMVASNQPDLILLDMNLPDINGLEVVQRLKNNPRHADIPVIALTANAMHGDRRSCIAAGCDGYIAKPVMRLELKNTIIHFIGSPTILSANAQISQTKFQESEIGV